MALMRSSRPTMSTTNACRVGMSKALTTPRSAASTKTCHTWTRPVSVRAARTKARSMAAVCVATRMRTAIVPVGDGAAERSQQEDRNLARKSDKAQQHRRAGQPVDEPGLRHGLHPRADQRDELPAEEQPVVPVPKCRSEAQHSTGRLSPRPCPACASFPRPPPHSGRHVEPQGSSQQPMISKSLNILPITRRSRPLRLAFFRAIRLPIACDLYASSRRHAAASTSGRRGCRL